MEKVFISYRRQDSAGYVRALYNELSQHFGAEQIFMDVDDIPLGTDFVQILNRNLQDCRVMLVVIGPQWLNIRSSSGTRRLDNADDFVVLEIAQALKNNFNIIPVLVNGALMPAEKDLPEILKPLARRQALVLDNKYYQHGIADLIKALEKELGKPATKPELNQPAPPLTSVSTNKPAKRRFSPALLGLLCTVLLGVAWYFWQQTQSGSESFSAPAIGAGQPTNSINITPDQPANVAAGFDCRQANTDVENAICDDNKTRKTDRELNRLFRKVSQQLPPAARQVLDQRQKTWLKQRDNYIRQHCFTQPNQARITHCIQNYYQQRISALARLPNSLISRAKLLYSPVTIHKTPDGTVLCQLQQQQMLTVYNGSAQEHQGVRWYLTQACGSEHWGVVRESQISEVR